MLDPLKGRSSKLSRVCCLLAWVGLATAVPAAEDSATALNKHLEQAQIHLDAEKYPLVVEELEKAIAIRADIQGAYYQLGLARWYLDDASGAKEAFLKELEFGSPDAFSLYYLGRIALSEGSTSEAVEHFERALKIGTILDVRRRLASGYISLGRIESAVALLEETVRKWPEQSESHYLLGRAYQRQSRDSEARREFDLAERWKNKLHSEIQDLVELRVLLENGENFDAAAKARGLTASGDPDVMLGTAIALGQHGFHSEALPILRRVVENRPRSPEVYFNMALAHVSLKRPESATPHLLKAVELRPEFYEARLLLGTLLAEHGSPDEAIPHIRAAARIQPENPRLLALLGMQYKRGRYYQDAVDALRTAVNLEPGDASLRFLLVDAYYTNHDFEQALKESRATLDAFPDLPNSHYQLAFQLENMGRFAEAKQHLEGALQLDADFMEAHRLLGEMVLRLGDAEGSLEHFRRALALDPGSGQAYAGLGKALVQLKRHTETAQEMERAVNVDPNLAPLRLYLSQAYRAMGRMDEAKREAAVFSELNKTRAAVRDQDTSRTYSPKQVIPE